MWWLAGSPRIDDSGVAFVVAIETPAWVFRAIFGVGALLGVASLTLTFLVKEADPIEPEIKRGAAIGEAIVAIETESRIRKGWSNLPLSYWYVLGVLVLFSFANSSDTFLLLRVREMGFSPWMVVMAYAVYNIAYSSLAYPAGALSDRIGRWRIIAVGWLIYACVYAGFALLTASQAWGVWPLMFTYGVYMALTEGTGKALIADHAPRDALGAALGIFYGLTGLTTFVSSLLTGVIWDRFGPAPAFLGGLCCALLAILGIFVFRLPSLTTQKRL